MAHTLTFDNSDFNNEISYITVNDVVVTSPYTITSNATIQWTFLGKSTAVIVNGVRYETGKTNKLTLTNTDIDITVEHSSGAFSPSNEGTINYTESATPTHTFKHFFDAGTIGSGTVKFRHYSQQEPSSGNVIKAGTYKWVDTPAIEELNNITGSSENSFIGKFKSSNITFDEIWISGIRVFKINYFPSQNFASLAELVEEGEEVDEVGYQNGEWYISGTFSYYAQEPSLQTFIVLEDINLTSEWNDTEIEQAILTWFTANTTKLS